MRIAFLFNLILLSLFIHISSPFAQSDTEKPAPAYDPRYNAVRVENETMLTLPFEQTEQLWSFMKERFHGDVMFDGMTFTTVESVEYFTDTYFDTPDRRLLKNWAGLRHRDRIGEGGSTKELIQLKTTPNLAGNAFDQNRSEIKFEVRERLKEGKVLDESNELLYLIKPSQKKDFIERLATFGIDAHSLARFIVIQQERRRIYFRQNLGLPNEKQYFTLTLDVTHSGKYWMSTDFSQLEVEIGENTFTKATEAERTRFLGIQAQLFQIVKEAFPSLAQDQAPKVVKVYTQLKGQNLLATAMMKYGDVILLGLGLSALLLSFAVIKYRERSQIRSLSAG